MSKTSSTLCLYFGSSAILEGVVTTGKVDVVYSPVWSASLNCEAYTLRALMSIIRIPTSQNITCRVWNTYNKTCKSIDTQGLKLQSLDIDWYNRP